VKRIAILASGAGSNADNILNFFKGSPELSVALIASNKPDAGVLEVAKRHGVATYILTKENFKEGSDFADYLSSLGVDLIVLAGFLWKVPPAFVQAFHQRIINVHPSLLPKFGGKGMFGHHVHEAVHAAGESESGITIHYVNEHYDEGAIIAQFKTALNPQDAASDIERKVRALELAHFSEVIQEVLSVC
jgi:phosphoribosylglycinamide formyltransferase-1